MIATMHVQPSLHQSAFHRFLSGLSALLKNSSDPKARGFARFEVDDDGHLVPEAQHVTVTMLPGETVEAFYERLRTVYKLKRGDNVEILENGGKYDTARLIIRAR